MEITYLPPERGTPMTIVAPHKTTTPIYVDVCVSGKWEKAAVLGRGLVSAGTVIAADSTSFASNPGAKPLPDHAEVLLPNKQEVKIRVRSNPELVSGGVVTGGIVASCTIPIAFTTESDTKYRSVWSRNAEGCSLSLTKAGEGPPSEKIVTTRKDAVCQAH
jgi:hypothetical protein